MKVKQKRSKKPKLLARQSKRLLCKKDGSEIRWEFLSITDVIPFDNARNGHFIFSRTEESEHPEHYLRSVQLKSKQNETFTLVSQS